MAGALPAPDRTGRYLVEFVRKNGVQQVYLRLRKLEALGMGDVKLMLSLGALVGVSGLLVMVLLSSLSALLAFLPALFQSGKGLHMKIPFGPFLCLGAILTLLFGESMLFSIFWT